MRTMLKIGIGIGAVSAALLVGACSKPELVIEKEKVPFPYKQIAAGEENPADNGPDDETVLDSIKGDMDPVPFSHYTHASNAKDGYKIGCKECHHAADTPDDAAGCKDCHEQGDELEEALLGPDNNVRIELEEHRTITPVLFNHYAHASFKDDGYKIGCERCHHIEGDHSPCSDCHEDVAQRTEDGKVIPKIKRALHLHCRNCHIMSKNDNAPTECKGCHKLTRHEKPQEMVALSRSYHVQCINCHQLVNASAQKQAPVKCDECHKPVKKK
ncbi:MAG: hypothetical protein JXX29_00460 [Deltaproteobacteria bacterium]|nr:hypothetical protein [Deltaproteobacteria bacterium]MBN2670108.1 hypothetical protein [Deltaproteobacteria bacterium]